MLEHAVYMTEDFTGNELTLVAAFSSQDEALRYAMLLLSEVDKMVSDRACYISSRYTYSNGNSKVVWRPVWRTIAMWEERYNSSAMEDRFFRQRWVLSE